MKNNNLKAKMNNQNNNVKGSPFTHVDPNKVLDIKNVIPDLTKINNPAPVINNQPACRCAAYEAGKLYFNDIRNNIKDYDPKLNMDYIGIGIDDHPEYPGNPEYFKVTLTTKSDGEIITDFNVKTTNGSDWSTTINNLAKIIADIVKSFQSEDLNVDDSALTLQKTMQDKLNQALLSSKLKMTSENKEEETKPEQINYPVLVEEVTDISNIIKCSINKDNNTGNKHKKKEQTEPNEIVPVLYSEKIVKEKGKDNILGFLSDEDYDYIIDRIEIISKASNYNNIIETYFDMILDKDGNECIELVKSIYDDLTCCPDDNADYTKDILFNIFMNKIAPTLLKL